MASSLSCCPVQSGILTQLIMAKVLLDTARSVGQNWKSSRYDESPTLPSLGSSVVKISFSPSHTSLFSTCPPPSYDRGNGRRPVLQQGSAPSRVFPSAVPSIPAAPIGSRGGQTCSKADVTCRTASGCGQTKKELHDNPFHYMYGIAPTCTVLLGLSFLHHRSG